MANTLGNHPGHTVIFSTRFSGIYSTEVGTTKDVGDPDNTPVRRLVRLHGGVGGRLAFEKWSDAETGEFQFNNIAAGRYYIVSFDHTGTYNGVVETGVVVPSV